MIDILQHEIEEKEALKQYLGQFYGAKAKKKQLEKRLRDIQCEKNNPISGMGYSLVPKSTTNKTNDGPAASLMIREEEIVERIKNQQEIANKMMLKVMNIMDFLPLDSVERTILEYRYIDCLSWRDISKEINMTRTPCNEYYNKGIDALLNYKKINLIIQEYIESKENIYEFVENHI